MKKVSLLFVVVCCSLLSSAQKVYFLYLQTEDQSPFYVRMGGKIYSSATSGFLILPNLIDTTYYLNVGFAKSTEPETKFSVAVNQRDKGFLIKKFDEGLALFDFEELSLIKSSASQHDNTVYETKSDAFSNVLAKAAGDPSIVRVPVGKKEDPKVEPEKNESNTIFDEQKDVVVAGNTESKAGNSLPADTVRVVQVEASKETNAADSSITRTAAPADTIAKQSTVSESAISQEAQPANKDASAVQVAVYKPSLVTRHSESSTTEGFGVVYFDKEDEHTDTIRVLIPVSKTKLPDTEKEAGPSEIVQRKDGIDSLAETVKNDVVAQTADVQASGVAADKQSCKNTATEKDFLRLRKRMAGGDTDEEMIDEAKKDFRTKCYSVEQIRYLSTLFLTSAAKYQFFDAAYEHVTDKTSFASLSSEIKDEYYTKRFKALIGE